MLRELEHGDKMVRRKHQAKQLAAISREGPLRPATDIDDRAEDPNKYARASNRLFDQFTRRPNATRFINGGVEHGFNVCGRIAMRGVEAYAALISGKESDGQASVEELAAILGRSYDPAVSPFAGKSADACQVMEYAFGLIKGAPPAAPVPFVISEVDGEHRLAPSPAIMPSVILGMQDRCGDTGVEGSCPARGMVLRQVWAATIGTCAVNEHLFPADVERINAGTYQLPQ